TDQLGAPYGDGALHEVEVGDDALHVNDVLGERRAAVQHASPKHPLRVPEAGLFVVTLGTKPLEDIQETGAALGLFDGQHAVVQAARAARITGQRQDLQ